MKITAHKERDGKHLASGEHRITINICQEFYDVDIKEKRYTHEVFSARLKDVIDKGTQPVIVTRDAYKTTWFVKTIELMWNFARKVHTPVTYVNQKKERENTTGFIRKRLTNL